MSVCVESDVAREAASMYADFQRIQGITDNSELKSLLLNATQKLEQLRADTRLLEASICLALFRLRHELTYWMSLHD